MNYLQHNSNDFLIQFCSIRCFWWVITFSEMTDRQVEDVAGDEGGEQKSREVAYKQHHIISDEIDGTPVRWR